MCGYSAVSIFLYFVRRPILNFFDVPYAHTAAVYARVRFVTNDTARVIVCTYRRRPPEFFLSKIIRPSSSSSFRACTPFIIYRPVSSYPIVRYKQILDTSACLRIETETTFDRWRSRRRCFFSLSSFSVRPCRIGPIVPPVYKYYKYVRFNPRTRRLRVHSARSWPTVTTPPAVTKAC